MTRIRQLSAAVAALAVTSGLALTPALTPAPSASAAVSCTGTSLIPDGLGNRARVPTVGNATGNVDCELGLGNSGTAVARLQINLDDCNLHAGLTADGIYGPATEQAVENVQAANGITVDGVYGPQTRQAMFWHDQKGDCTNILPG